MAGEMQRRMARLALSGSNRIRFYEVLKMQIMSGRTLEQAMLNIREVYTRGGQRFHPLWRTGTGLSGLPVGEPGRKPAPGRFPALVFR
ncbi:hypothetical protein [Escherichia coli]|uniref:hypothetical protein n=1 Tax=Escherichia coli TaxID=562 RepID=UPI000A43810A|nr:hypothetical protein [Escherichia coli]